MKKKSFEWQIATVTGIKSETGTVKTLTFSLPFWTPHLPGQHYDVRLTAPDGYQTERSYSIASEPERNGEIDLTVERLEDGEVSTYLDDVLVVGDQLELRGPIGGYFVWEARMGGPVLLVGGGSGVVPLMSMIRHRHASESKAPVWLLYSARSPEEVIYADELNRLCEMKDGLEVIYTFTRQQPPGWTGYQRRIDAQMLHEVIHPINQPFRAYICGPTLLVESAANQLVQLGIAPENIKTERFGPTGPSVSGGVG
jgi:ferredoxin-NADP reductase